MADVRARLQGKSQSLTEEVDLLPAEDPHDAADEDALQTQCLRNARLQYFVTARGNTGLSFYYLLFNVTLFTLEAHQTSCTSTLKMWRRFNLLPETPRVAAILQASRMMLAWIFAIPLLLP